MSNQKLIEAAGSVGFESEVKMGIKLSTSMPLWEVNQLKDLQKYLYMHEFKRWFKVVHDVDVWACPYVDEESIFSDGTYSYFVLNQKVWVIDGSDFGSEPEALEAGLLKACEILKGEG